MAALLSLGAFFFHLPRLNDRPMHTDEAVHAVKLGILLETGEYEYNPHEYHGPLIYFVALPFVRATGATSLAEIPNEWPLRVSIVVFSAALAFLTMIMGRGLGRAEAFYAAVLFATSPAFALYGKYYIQEVPFVFFCMAGLAVVWLMLQTGQWRWAALAGVLLGCAIGLKETWIMILGSAGLTAWLLHMTTSTGLAPRPIRWKRELPLAAFCGAVALFVGVAILSNFFRSHEAVGNTFSALTGYINRGISGDSSTFGSSVHNHPWYYYFQLLGWPPVEGPWLWTEGGTLLLGTIGVFSVIKNWVTVRRPWHFITIITILLTGFFSAIPYKTPWNVLPMFAGWTLLAGRGAAALAQGVGLLFVGGRRGLALDFEGASAVVACVRFVMMTLLLAWPATLAVQTYRATILRPADVRNPYAYSPTSSNALKLADRAEQIAAASPAGRAMLIQILSPANDYWPLPWYLRRFSQVGYYPDASGVVPEAAMVITTVSTDPDTEPPPAPVSEESYIQEFYGLRPDVMLSVYIRRDLWDRFMANNQ